MEQIIATHAMQPFFVVENESYDRMMAKLKDGQPFVKSFIYHCPHKSKKECQCHFFKNYLDKNGNIVRNVAGQVKPVLKLYA